MDCLKCNVMSEICVQCLTCIFLSVYNFLILFMGGLNGQN